MTYMPNGDYINEAPHLFMGDEKTMKCWFRWDEETTYPAHYVVCDNCDGRGSHSKHLGVITREQFDNDWDDDQRDDYFSGSYDMQCEVCKGLRVVIVPFRERCTKEQLEEIDERIYDDRMDRQTQLSELRYGA